VGQALQEAKQVGQALQKAKRVGQALQEAKQVGQALQGEEFTFSEMSRMVSILLSRPCTTQELSQ
jgi:hypothetical protein